MPPLDDTLVEMARNINLIAFIQNLGFTPFNRRGDKAVFLSPLRAESNPSFSVYRYKNVFRYFDFGNGDKGDAIDFVRRYYSVDFRIAVEILTNVSLTTPVPYTPAVNITPGTSDENKVEWVRSHYIELFKNNTLSAPDYFLSKSVKYHPQMGSVLYIDKQDKQFIATPIPYPERMRGLECRGINHDNRKTLGHKTLWFLRRNTSRILVAESILDALASELILRDNNMSLCALNGVSVVDQLEQLVQVYKPREVLLALDNDDPGLEAQEKAIQIIRPVSDIVIINNHKMAGVKDMHKLLLKAGV